MFYLHEIHKTSFGIVLTRPVNLIIVRSFTDTAECSSLCHQNEGHPSLLLFKLAEAGLSNPFRDPRFRVSASGVDQSSAFAFGVPHDINAFHRYTMSSEDPFHPLSLTVSRARSRLSREILRETNETAYTPFTPNDSG